MADTRFIYVADVYCPWCFGFAPIMKRLTLEHPEFGVRVIGGDLISQPMTLEEDLERKPDLVEFWHEVEQTTGRSLAGAIRAAENREQMRLYSPGADELLAIMRHFAPGHELDQLIMLEDMAYTDGVDLFTDESYKKIAERWHIPFDQFKKALDAPESIRATEKNLERAADLMGEITSYPSVLLQRDGRIDAVTRGYVRYETVAARLDWAMRDLGVQPEIGTYCSWSGACTLGRHDNSK